MPCAGSSCTVPELQVIGAGMWRTATYSLKLALEELTGQPCLHMSELMPSRKNHHNNQLRRDWLKVVKGDRALNWPKLFEGYGSTTDWPALMFWQDIVDFYPNAKVLLSTRDPESWWQSISQTVLQVIPESPQNDWEELIAELFKRDFVSTKPTKQEALDFYHDHNERVRKNVPKERLIEWQIGDGWAPLCAALDLPEPNKPFPHTNSTAEFRRGNRLSGS